MGKSRNSRGILLTNNLPQLQNLIKRDPTGYKEEFLTQHNHYLSLLRLHSLTPTSSTQNAKDKDDELFSELITFICQVAQCYPTETKELTAQLKDLLLGAGAVKGDLRRTIIKNMVMLRNKEVIDSIELLQTLLPLLPHVPSSLRSVIRHTILTDLKTSNAKAKNHRLNRVVQSLLFGMVESGMGAEVTGDKGKGKGKEKGGEAMWAVMMVRELWKKSVWNDAKTVSIVALAAFHPNTKVQSAAIHFFLGSDQDDGEPDSSDDETNVGQARKDIKAFQHRLNVGNTSNRKGEKKMRALQKEASRKRKNKALGIGTVPNFPALELLHDPQTFGERLYENLNRYDKQYSLDHKILIMSLLARVMGAHKLCILGFYSYIIKYLTYHQLQVTLILVSLAQSVHELTPPDILTPVIRKLAQEFVHPGVGAEVIAAGINAIREICRRQPWCMEEDLLSDLIEYRKSKDKGVVTASRGLLQLFREVNPGMLQRRERGKAATMGHNEGQALAYGHVKEADGIEGLELLEEHFAALRKEANGGVSDGSDVEFPEDQDDEGGWDNWDRNSDGESDSSGWENVDDNDDELEISDSDDDEPKKPKVTRKAEEMDGDDVPKAKKAKITKAVVEEDEDENEDADVDMDDDAKSVVSAAPSAATDSTKKLSLLAQQKILTPADFALLNELRLKAAKELVDTTSSTSAKRKLAALEASKKHIKGQGDDADRFLTELEILGPRKKAKADYEERMESIKKGREGREKFGSFKGKKMKDTPSSSTNREKARNKPIMMALHSSKVVNKKKASLRDKQISLRAAIDKRKKQKR